MSTHIITFLNIKKEKHPKLSQICSYGICSKGPNNEFETAVVHENEPSVFEPLKFCCIWQDTPEHISIPHMASGLLLSQRQ